jgi:outer membrane protein OmpA-like peptidoglycan-associated protein
MIYRYYFNQLQVAAIIISAGVVLAGCVGVADNSEQLANARLEQAREAYVQAQANPLVESYSLKTLLGAGKSLQEAEQKKKMIDYDSSSGTSKKYNYSEKKLIFNDISRLAYLAERQSQISVAQAEGVVARNEVVKLGRERAEVQLRKSQLEQKLLKQDLDEKAFALESAKQELATASSEAERARIIADIQTKEAALANALAEAKAKEAEKARAEAEEQAREAQRAKVELEMLMKEMSELQGQLTDRGIVLTIGDVLFATGKSDLNISAQRSMEKIAEFLEKKPNRSLLVEGHTDNVGSDEYNQKLSEQRAASVKRALEKAGIISERIVTVGYGKNYPMASNDNATGRQQNRRVEAIILNEGVRPESQFRK